MLRIDDLAHLTGIPSRTIRFYNTQGLLPAPIMRGRIAYYSSEHLLVLKLIKELKDQQNLPLEVIKQLLEIRARHGDVQMNLALKQRLLRPRGSGDQEVQLAREEMAQQAGVAAERIDELTRQGLLFPSHREGQARFSTDDLFLLQLYQHIEQLGLPMSLPALMRFQLRQLTRSELATFEQHLLSRWREEGLSLEQQTQRFEEILTLTDTLLSLLHRKLLYQA
jgi:DNA-binding transcriptional MerR regulator